MPPVKRLYADIVFSISSNHCVAVATGAFAPYIDTSRNLTHSPVLITYDYLITFDDEVAHLWSTTKRKVPSALLFACSRVTLLVLALAYIACCVQAAYRTVRSAPLTDRNRY